MEISKYRLSSSDRVWTLMAATAMSLIAVVSPVESAESAASIKAKAMVLWRNDNPTKHPKGSCASCHGADFFDLARIGSTDADVTRRAKTDGATDEEAKALVTAINNMRAEMKLPKTDPRSFRPFQPGGAQLLPKLTDSRNVAAVKRDIAFAENVATLLPTMTGVRRIGTLAQATLARNELLDIARGTNQAGANSKSVQLRDLQVAMAFPLWSADKFQGLEEGTFNDWVADVGMIPKPGQKPAWEALENAYLAKPNNETFWAMYAAADDMLQVATPLTNCSKSLTTSICESARDGILYKFRTALTGQHRLRMETLGRKEEFLQGAIAFSYLDTNQSITGVPKEVWNNRSMLPSDLWEVGDGLGRKVLASSLGKTMKVSDLAKNIGYPQFVVDSVDPNRTLDTERSDIQLDWMWMGFTMDPTFARIQPGIATQVGEYLVAALTNAQLFNHSALMTHMRLATSVYLPEAASTLDKTKKSKVKRIANDRKHEILNYSYFLEYGRNVLIGFNIWGDSVPHGGTPLAQALKDRSTLLWSTMVSNGMRMNLLLLQDELQNRPQTLDVKWLSDEAKEIASVGADNWLPQFKEHWAKFQPQNSAADTALRKSVAEIIVAKAKNP